MDGYDDNDNVDSNDDYDDKDNDDDDDNDDGLSMMIIHSDIRKIAIRAPGPM